MAQFRFRLEAVLRIREFEEDRAKQVFFELQKDFRREEGFFKQLVRQREAAKQSDRGNGKVSREFDVQDLLGRRRHINVLYQRIAAKGEQLTQIGHDLESARKTFGQARVRRRVVEKIKERKKREFLQEEGRRESRELDEIGQNYSQIDKGGRS